jgi:hypothetical protein
MGELVARGNTQALGEAIVRVLENRSRYVRPLAQIDATFNLEDTVNRYEQYLREASAAARRG